MRNAGDGLTYTFACDALAHLHKILLVVAVSGAASAVKALRAALTSNNCKPEFDWYKPGEDVFGAVGLTRDGAGYVCSKSSRLGYGTHHMVALSARPGLLVNGDDEALWQHLRHHTSTPLLREWLPTVRAALSRQQDPPLLLEPTLSFGCAPAIVQTESGHLDRIVQTGIKNGALSIPA